MNYKCLDYLAANGEPSDLRFGPKIDQIDPKLDKLGTFSNHISVYYFGSPKQILDFLRSSSVHFGSVSRNVLKYDLKKSRISPIWGQSDPLWAQIWPLIERLSMSRITHNQTQQEMHCCLMKRLGCIYCLNSRN